MEKVFLVIIASFNEPYYTEMVKIRIKQMRDRGISFYFLINGEIPEGIDLQPHEYMIEPVLSVSVLSKNQTTPWATKAFQTFLQEFYKRADSDTYDYILRLNVSTYVNFQNFVWMLQFIQKERYIGGPFFNLDNKIFCNGTAMLFSKDVARAFAYETSLDSEFCRINNDDVVISWSLMDRFPLHDLNYFFLWIERYTDVPDLEEFVVRIKREHVFFRVKNEAARDKVDAWIWRVLYHFIK